MPELMVPPEPLHLLTFLLGPPESATFGDGTNDEPEWFDPDARFGSSSSDAAMKSYTFRELKYLVRCLASGLVKAGLRSGDRLLLISSESIYTPVIMYATWAAGGIFSARTPNYTAEQHSYLFKDCRPKILLASSEAIEVALSAARNAGLNICAFLYNGLLPSKPELETHAPLWDILLDYQGRADYTWKRLSSEEDMDRTLVIEYTSGTTSEPKGVMHTHRSYIHAIVQVVTHLELWHRQRTWLTTYSYDGLIAKHVGVLALKSRFELQIFIYGSSQERSFHNALISSQADTLWCSKQPFDSMVRARGKRDIECIRTVHVAGQIIPRRSRELVNSFFGGRNVVKVFYGCTEAGMISTEQEFNDTGESSCVGQTLAAVKIQIVDEQGYKLLEGESGQLHIQSAGCMKGYWRNQDATAEVLTKDGWLDTGDLAYVQDGRLHITGRSKEMIKVRGKSFQPYGIEEILLQMPTVELACVVGIAAENGEELPAAFIVPVHGKHICENDVQSFMSTVMNNDHQLTGGITFISQHEIPYGGNGKMERRKLKLRANAAYQNRIERA